MKDKTVAGLLAFFLGTFGIHRFYLGQVGLGIFYALFFWTFIPSLLGILDAIILLSMDERKFDGKYNWRYLHPSNFPNGEMPVTRQERRDVKREQRKEWRDYESDRRYASPPAPPALAPKKENPFKVTGIKKFKDFDYQGAIEDFEKALTIDANDVATHFNLACAYSLMENVPKAFFHLDRAVALGFDDTNRIKTHDALAFLRIQDEFIAFERNNYRLPAALNAPPTDNLLDSKPDLLEQLKRLAELREKGLLSEEEFVAEKKKILG